MTADLAEINRPAQDAQATLAPFFREVEKVIVGQRRMLDRLVRRGYVTRLDGDHYSLTLKLFGLAQLHAPVRRLVSYATPLMRELADSTLQANQLVVFDRGAAVLSSQGQICDRIATPAENEVRYGDRRGARAEPPPAGRTGDSDRGNVIGGDRQTDRHSGDAAKRFSFPALGARGQRARRQSRRGLQS